MNILILGSTAYKDKMKEHAAELTKQGNVVMLPILDRNPDNLSEIQICAKNLLQLEAADEAHILWDGRSTGTIFDLGMCFALRKPIRLIHLNPLSMQNLFKQYDAVSREYLDEGTQTTILEEIDADTCTIH